MMSDKLAYVSLFRVISMTMIVLYHSLCFYIGIWWYLPSEVIPLWFYLSAPIVIVGLSFFVFISGFLYSYLYFEKGKYRQMSPFWKGKIRRLIVPYVLWGCLMVILMPIAFQWTNMYYGIAHLWFLLSLFELFILIVIINRIASFIPQKWMGCYSFDVIVLFLSFVSVYLWCSYSTHLCFLSITNTLYYFPFFFAGYLFAKYKLYELNVVRYSFLFFMIGLILLFLLSTSILHDRETLYRIPSLIVTCSTIILCRWFCFRYRIIRLISVLDKNSMGIYIFNQFVVFIMLLIPSTNNFLRLHPYIGPLIIFLVSFVVPWMLSSFFSRTKYLSWMIGV